ncbi:MAG TPA: hypothetical protein VFP87_12945 [Chitinophagaceae bacterium]|nr:hypothetical protein [Chitinophagaceae bacterium]
MCADELNKIVITGTVEKKSLGGTSKSSHVGFVLQTNAGSVKLRREGGNPFYDDFFEKYENQQIQVEGYDMDQYFLVTNIKHD